VRAWARARGALTVERAEVSDARLVPGPGVGPGRRPEWMKVRADLGTEYRRLKQLVQDQELHTVCEEAGCPNIYECWSQRTATFMILGDRCTRACGFCLVDTRQPFPIDPDEPVRVADAVASLGLVHAVVTSVARDDVPDGGAAGFAATIDAIRARNPETTVEVLIPDCKGDADALDVIFRARPDVLNHNLETVARLQRLARPSAGYARSLGVLARAKDAGLVVKSGIILGLGEDTAEARAAIADLRNVGVDVLTLGQYLRPSARHLPVVRWWTPDEFAELGTYAEGLGFAHVEAGPLVRSSYHAKRAAEAGRAVAAMPVVSGVRH
jgi:lipoyl synthase